MEQLTPKELKDWIAAERDFLLVDVREHWERDDYNIGGIHIPMGELASVVSQLPKDTDIVVYCEKGIRSVIAIQRLEGAGFERLFNLAGGMKTWKLAL